ncbi:DUF4062 domain-containing protein [Enterococcus faecalis]|uniref:DUF4062 domain-containing protein n=1 Tax=Enterococcus faecalis TaxID=1351 RepID=UPI0019E413F3|nr:DUF4062 domain-containing protein [Enterococcus faecalis]EGO7696238.1 DUF4062 domain-containing protein [Enterococcus faecalis]EIA8296144.1 DUF4062 domain-containing protein [Enterococcus faecalis]ELU9017122.1 DUF4062 domain-containing protein [Enterococcus faecalis]MDQ4469151.1 DUF4062 domain-containing protein [Enterococcus faecalis]MDT2121779.1 DUF4062 domain-containing protein [Enterococcus faecalis]
MAIPKIFVSSTYYDLMHVRTDIEAFIKNLGYEPVLHERNSVTYNQVDTLEDSCYKEIDNCEILVCIIGNKFGTESNSNNYSITMKELQTAIKQQKKVYAFIQKDVSVENRVYLANKNSSDFVTAVVDDVRIHDFIADLKQTVKNFPITDFESVNDIIDSLRSQFAGLFQNLLQRETTLTESKTLYDLNSVSTNMENMVEKMTETNNEVLNMLNSTLFVTHDVTAKLMSTLSLPLNDYRILIHDKKGMTSFIETIGFIKTDEPFIDEYKRSYLDGKLQFLTISEKIFNDQDQLLRYVDHETLENAFTFKEEEKTILNLADDDLPF